MKESLKLLSGLIFGAIFVVACGGGGDSERAFEQEDSFISFPSSSDKNLVKADEVAEGAYELTQIKTSLNISDMKASYAFQQDVNTPGSPAEGDKVQTRKSVEELKTKLEETDEYFWPYIEFNLPLEIVGGDNINFEDERYYWNQWKTEKADNEDWGWSLSGSSRASYIFASEIIEQGTLKGKGIYEAEISGVKLAAAMLQSDENELKAFVRYALPVEDSGDGTALVELTYTKQ